MVCSFKGQLHRNWGTIRDLGTGFRGSPFSKWNWSEQLPTARLVKILCPDCWWTDSSASRFCSFSALSMLPSAWDFSENCAPLFHCWIISKFTQKTTTQNSVNSWVSNVASTWMVSSISSWSDFPQDSNSYHEEPAQFTPGHLWCCSH